MADVLVRQVFRHQNGRLAVNVDVDITARDSDVVIQTETTDAFGTIAIYMPPGQYDWMVFGTRIPFDVVQVGGSSTPPPPSTFSHHQTTPAAQWNLDHPAGVKRHPVILLDDEPARPVYTDVEHVSDTLTILTFPNPVSGWAHL